MSDEPSDNPPEAPEEDVPPIVSTYSRAEAIEDGTLVDITERAREAGIHIPTAVTRAVWRQYVELSEAARKAGNDVRGRLWDIIWMFRCAVLRMPNQNELTFELYVVTDRIQPTLVMLKALVHGGDDGEPVITIMLPEEN